MRPDHLDNVPTFPGSETGGDGIDNGDSSEDSNGGSSLPIFPGFQDEDGDDGLDIDSILPGLPDNGAPAVTNPPPVAPGEFTKGTPMVRCNCGHNLEKNKYSRTVQSYQIVHGLIYPLFSFLCDNMLLLYLARFW